MLGHGIGRRLDAGAFALGFVNSLFVPEEVLGGDFEAIEARARGIFQTLAERSAPSP